MKLSKKHREDFVEAVMSDMPTKNYPTQAEDLARKLCQAKHKELGLDKVDPSRLSYASIYVRVWASDIMLADRPKDGCYYPANTFAQIAGRGLNEHEIAEITDCPEMMVIRQGFADELNMLNNLHKQVTAVITACSTLKQAKEALPEFIKYLPEDLGNPVDRTLPVVGNLVADLSKAGWPKKDSKRK